MANTATFKSAGNTLPSMAPSCASETTLMTGFKIRLPFPVSTIDFAASKSRRIAKVIPLVSSWFSSSFSPDCWALGVSRGIESPSTITLFLSPRIKRICVIFPVGYSELVKTVSRPSVRSSRLYIPVLTLSSDLHPPSSLCTCISCMSTFTFS